MLITKVKGSGLVAELRCNKVGLLQTVLRMSGNMSVIFLLGPCFPEKFSVSALHTSTCLALHLLVTSMSQDEIDRQESSAEGAFFFSTKTRHPGTDGDCRTQQELANPRLMELIRKVWLQGATAIVSCGLVTDSCLTAACRYLPLVACA